jgi:hypothetical protein
MDKEHKKAEQTAVETIETETYIGEVDGEENEYLITFKKPYVFDGTEHMSIDLSGLDNLKASDMIAANKVLDRTGSFSFLPEMSLQYACIIAAKATKLPIEFFNGLHPKEAVKVKNKVVSFFFGQD